MGAKITKTRMTRLLRINKVLRCGGTYLLKYKCPYYDEGCLSGKDNMFCIDCGKEHGHFIIDISCSIKKNIVAMDNEMARREVPVRKTIKRMLQDQDNKCAYCCIELTCQYHIEHITPVCFGGNSKKDNLCLSCSTCNHTAGGLVFKDFQEKQEYILRKKGEPK